MQRGQTITEQKAMEIKSIVTEMITRLKCAPREQVHGKIRQTENMLWVEINRYHLPVYSHLNMRDEILSNVNYNDGRIAQGVKNFQHLAKLEIEYLGPESKRRWTVTMEDGAGCHTSCGSMIDERDVFELLAKALSEGLQISKPVW